MKSTRLVCLIALLWLLPLCVTGAQEVCTPIPDGLISWWPGEGDATDIAGHNDGSLHGGTTFATGKVGQAFSFDGDDDEVDAPANNMGHLPQFTIEAWVKHRALPWHDYDRYVTLEGESTAVLQCAGWGDSKSYDFWMIIDGAYFDVQVWDVMEVGVFRHVAGTFDGNVMRLYLDGVEVGSNWVWTEPCCQFEGVTMSWAGQAIDGLVDEVGVYNRALTASEIRNLHDAGSAGKCLEDLPVLVDLEIVGFDRVPENMEVQYSAIAHYDDGPAWDVTSLAGWSVEPDTHASIDDVGLLTTGEIAAGEEQVTIRAEYTQDEITVETERSVVIFDTPDVGVQVFDRARFGNTTEDLTVVTAGPFANHIAVLDGTEVWGVPIVGAGNLSVPVPNPRNDARKLFDLNRLDFASHPTGIAYIETEELFVVNDPWQPTTLFLVDHLGRPRETRTIQYLDGYVPWHLEGLAYIPETSPVYPDHLVLWAFGGGTRLEILRRDGRVVDEVPVPFWGSSVTSFGPDRLLVGGFEGDLHMLDFAGNFLDGPVREPDIPYLEGLVQLPDGRVVAADYRSGGLLFYDEELHRLRQHGECHIGVGASYLLGAAWDDETDRVLILNRASLPEQRVSAVPLSLDRARPVIDLERQGFSQAQGLASLPAEELIAVAHLRSPAAVLLFDEHGTLDEEINVSALGEPVAVEHIPPTDELAVQFIGAGPRIEILARSGAHLRTLDLTATGIEDVSAFAFFNPDHPSGGQILAFDRTERAVVTDFAGNLLSDFNFRDLLQVEWPRDLAAITSGPQAGGFIVANGTNSELVLFGLNAD